MEYTISVFDSHKAYKTFLKQHQSIKQQFIDNTITCFMKDAYESSNNTIKKRYTYEAFLKMILKHYVLHLQSKRTKQTIINSGLAYMCKVFFHDKDDVLLFSCSLEVSPKLIEIHDVCVAPQETGKGRCKEFIAMVCDYIKSTFPYHNIKIVCEKKNTPACKCYTRVFGPHRTESKDRFKFMM